MAFLAVKNSVRYVGPMGRSLSQPGKEALNKVSCKYLSMDSVKTSFVLPKSIYVELKKRAIEEGRTVREVLIDAILNYLSLKGSGRERLVKLILSPVPGAGPNDVKEYDYSDIGE